MAEPEAPTDSAQLMLAVARLRVEGRTWEQIAEVLPRSADTMSHWPYRRAAEWAAALEAPCIVSLECISQFVPHAGYLIDPPKILLERLGVPPIL